MEHSRCGGRDRRPVALVQRQGQGIQPEHVMASNNPQKPTEPPDRLKEDAGVPAKPPKKALSEGTDAEEEEEE